MIAYQTRPDGVFIGIVECDESPLEPGVFLVPGGAVKKEPPDFEAPNRARWTGKKWVIEPTPEGEGGEPEAPPVDENNIPVAVSDRQFAQALAETGRITWDEARAWGSRGEVPEAILAAVTQIEDELTRNRALMFLEAATSFERRHPMTKTLAAAMGWERTDLDALWRFAATL